MTWQEILFDVAPLVVSFVSAIVLFCRTGQKKYLNRFFQAMCSTVHEEEQQLPHESNVSIKTDNTELQFKPSDYGLTADEVVLAFQTFLENQKNEK